MDPWVAAIKLFWQTSPMNRFRNRLHEVIFEADTPAGKNFDIALICCILFSVLLVMLDSVGHIHEKYGYELYFAEWFFTGIFTLEFILRLIALERPFQYVRSFFGMVDLLAILPTYVSLLFPGTQSLLVLRTFRLLRIFRIFKLGNHLGQAEVLHMALRTSRPKITVFLVGVAATVITTGAIMYLVEGPANGFTSIPMAMYWSIVTMTTVGFGDITPRTSLGQVLASALMIIGYGVIAVPTGIVTTELARASRAPLSTQACPRCGRDGHDGDAIHCKFCGSKL